MQLDNFMKTKFIEVIYVVIVSLIIQGCVGGNGNDDDSSQYEGIWYSNTYDSYYVIQNNNTIEVKECSVNHGYKTSYTGTISGNTVTIFNSDFKLNIVEDELNFSIDGINIAAPFAKKSSIPELCTGDAIEITFFSPEIAIEGDLTTFIVNIDYRLVSANSGTIHLGFNTNTEEPTSFRLTDSSFEIENTETGSASLTAVINPVYYAPPYEFLLYVNLSPSHTTGPWIPFANALTPVVITPLASNHNTALFMNPMPLISDNDLDFASKECTVLQGCNKGSP